jgi:WD40 repeat protein
MRTLILTCCAILFASSVFAQPIAIETPDRAEPVRFEREVLPILRANCAACHNARKAEGNLLLDTPQTLLDGGDSGPAIVAGKSAESLLLKVAAHQEESFMPPSNNAVGARDLTPRELGLIKLWIDQGAKGDVSASRSVQWQNLPAKLQPILAVAVTPDGQFGACSRGNQLFIYHLPTAALVAKLPAHQDIVRALAFDSTGDLLACGGFREVKLWRRPRVQLGGKQEHAANVTALAISSDGAVTASSDESGKLRIGKITLDAHTTAVGGLAFSADAAVLYSVSQDKTLKAWNVADGKQLSKTLELAAPLTSLAVVKSGEWLVVGDAEGTVRVYEAKAIREEAESVAPLKEIKAHGGAVAALVAIAGKSTEFCSGGADGLVRCWNAETGEQLKEFKHDSGLTSLAIGPDAKRIASAGGGIVKLWNTEDRQPVAQLVADPRLAVEVARADAAIVFSKSFIQHANSDIKSYEGAERRIKTTEEAVKKAEEELVKVQKTRDEKKAAVEKDKDDAKKLEAAMKAAAEAETAVDVAMKNIDRAKAVAERAVQTLAGEKKAVAEREEQLKQEEAAKAAVIEKTKTAKASFRSVAFTTDGQRLLVGADDGAIHSYTAEKGVAIESFAAQASPVIALVAADKGTQVITAAGKEALSLTASGDWKLERTIGGPDSTALADRVLALAFSPSGQLLATGSGLPSAAGELKLWNVADGQLAREIPKAHADTVFALAFSPDGQRLASGGADRLVKVFDVASGEAKLSLAGHTAHVLSVAWRADGKQLVSTGTDQMLKLWDVERGTQVRSMKGTMYQLGSYKGEVTAATFIGTSEQIVATSGDGTVRLHRASSENEFQVFAGSKSYQYAVAATPDGQTILAGGADGILRWWNNQGRDLKKSLEP